jgi:hypothetical protein
MHRLDVECLTAPYNQPFNRKRTNGSTAEAIMKAQA